jgi:hypothetical protein
VVDGAVKLLLRASPRPGRDITRNARDARSRRAGLGKTGQDCHWLRINPTSRPQTLNHGRKAASSRVTPERWITSLRQSVFSVTGTSTSATMSAQPCSVQESPRCRRHGPGLIIDRFHFALADADAGNRHAVRGVGTPLSAHRPRSVPSSGFPVSTRLTGIAPGATGRMPSMTLEKPTSP